MRYINIEALIQHLPDDWELRAKAATDEVRNAPPDERKKVIDKHDKLWQSLGKELAQLSHGKCWYCESLEKRSDKHIDHYRPKNRVDGSPTHTGYWWLAFDWRNYRLSCTYCNCRRVDKTHHTAGGKQAAFPLLDESTRVYSDTADLSQEVPELLDPTNQVDPGLLWFDENGRTVEKYREAQHDLWYKRAHTSIEFYHLNHIASVEARKLLFRRIRDLVNEGHVHSRNWKPDNESARIALEAVIKELRKLISRESEYSAAARAMLLGLRHPDSQWIDGVLSGE